MQKHTTRAIIIALVLVVGLIYIYPTLGWMTLSQEERTKRLEAWKQEDLEYHQPSLMNDSVRAVKRWAMFDRDWVINLGLDLQGGVHVVLGFDIEKADPAILAEMRENGMNDSEIKQYFQQIVLQRIERRINEFEAKEPVITTRGTDQIQVQLPGEKDLDRALELIRKAAVLQFHLVAGPDETGEVFAKIHDHFQKTSKKAFIPLLVKSPTSNVPEVPEENIEAVRALVKEAEAVPGLIPEGKAIAFGKAPKPLDTARRYQIYVMSKKPDMMGTGLRSAVARPDDRSLEGHYQILFQLDAAGGRDFAELTGAHISEPLAIVIDGVVESAPTIQSRIGANGQITGRFDRDEAHDLAIALSSGSMPVPLTEDFTGLVGASLGRDLVFKGVMSSVLGIAAVVIFMLVYYHVGGLVANVALVANALLVLAAMSYFKATLTLPGIAGLILTIGMAVDANVLIFERIREELRNGKSLLASIDSGYARATVTILDANVTTLIAAAVLMQFGTGAIEGFAVTLTIGVCSSVFTALVLTRAIFDFMTNRKMLSKLTMLSMVKPDTKIRFMDRRRLAIGISVAVILIGMAFFAYRGSDNFGVDFMTGTNMLVSLDGKETIADEDVRSRLAAAGFSDATVQAYERPDATATEFLIRVGKTPDVAPEDLAAGDTAADEGNASRDMASVLMQRALADLSTDPATMIQRVETVGPAVGAQLRLDALRAILYSLIFIIAYLWFRFELKFAIGAVVALLHDVLVIVGVFAICPDRQISLPVVAALLTIIGYSLNDTIVVFDRIREDMKLYRGRGLTLPQIMDLSINQTLSRTLLTSLTTLFVVVVLFFFGGDAINDFAFALMIGIVVGTYSSIYVASPVVYLLQKIQGKRQAAAGADAQARNRRYQPKTKEASTTSS